MNVGAWIQRVWIDTPSPWFWRLDFVDVGKGDSVWHSDQRRRYEVFQGAAFVAVLKPSSTPFQGLRKDVLVRSSRTFQWARTVASIRQNRTGRQIAHERKGCEAAKKDLGR